ncbi:MAG: N-acetylmuramoyl-L-alanine amidase, partial [Nitrospirota bacterium]
LKDKKKRRFRSAWELCAARFDKIASSSPRTAYGRLASYFRAETREKLYKVSRVRADLSRAEEAYSECIRKYPKSREAAKARKRLKALGRSTGGGAVERRAEVSSKVDAEHRAAKGRVITLSRASRPVNADILPETSAAKPPAFQTASSSLPPATARESGQKSVAGTDSAPLSTAKRLVRINEIRHWSNIGYTRIVIDMEGAVRFSSQRLENPYRLFFDLKDARMPKDREGVSIDVNDGVLKRIRASQYNADTVRVVLDLVGIASSRTLMLQNPTRLVIDVTGGNKLVNTARRAVGPAVGIRHRDVKLTSIKRTGGYKNISSPAPSSGAETVPADIKPGRHPLPTLTHRQEPVPPPPVAGEGKNQPKPCGIGTIVIDPGHGGKDTGAIGCNGLYEKNVVLDVGLRLRAIIRKNFNCKVVMTRDRDIFIPLDERPGIAVQNDADLFISIHANASRNPSAHGIETYLLNLTKDRNIMEVAERENMTELKSMGPLESILKDLILDSKRDDSLRLAHCVQSCLISDLQSYDVKNKGVKQGPFLVLYGASMPSILTEIGFITNPGEEARLAEPRYRQKIAQAIFDGIKDYLKSPTVTAYQAPK